MSADRRTVEHDGRCEGTAACGCARAALAAAINAEADRLDPARGPGSDTDSARLQALGLRREAAYVAEGRWPDDDEEISDETWVSPDMATWTPALADGSAGFVRYGSDGEWQLLNGDGAT